MNKPSEKPRKYCKTAGFDNAYDPLDSYIFITLVESLWKKYPVDMFVFERPIGGIMNIKAHGYHADTDLFIDEYVYSIEGNELKDLETFWLKYDYYGDHWLGTFLFPDEYQT